MTASGSDPASDPTSASVGAPPAPVTRREVWNRLGAPTDQEGSVNDPRTHDEHDVRWNEKWIYRSGARIVRVVLWHRYDLLGVFAIGEDGGATREALPD